MRARLKKPLIGLLAIMVVLGLGAAVYLLGPFQGGNPVQISINVGPSPTATPSEMMSKQPPAPVSPAGNRSTPIPRPPSQGVLLSLGTKVINLADPGGYRYLKVGIVLEILPEDPKFSSLKGEARIKMEEEVIKELKNRSPVFEDIVTTLLSSKTFEQVFTIQGKERLKAEMKEQINARLGTDAVLEVYFTDFVIQ